MAITNKVAIILKPKVVTEFSTVLPNLTNWLIRRKVDVYFEKSQESRILKIFKNSQPENFNFINRDDIAKKCKILITLGGDGTLIGAVRSKDIKKVNIFGINMGNLGFIAEFAKHDFYEGLEMALKGKLKTRKVQIYQAEITRPGHKKIKLNFMNDAVITKSGISRMFNLELEANGESIYNLAGDGLIVSTPIGSTAYSLAANGPILHPSVKGVVLTPICPHALTHRPMVLPDNETLSIIIPRGQEDIYLTIDGQKEFKLEPKDEIQIKKSRSSHVNFYINEERNYFRTLKEKFKYGRR
ncbi:NAD(+)/NADH kinase [Halobacteriovorax sp. XZX-3]|uniref:NAD(+)/NADH kinase n=1 Tax=unclassified Halobacteriovorax TaxID=2639665 RepID=UPI000CD31654|nr:NAD(+)/NADH kinase [Halobacteriovorax sp. DA5]POB13117.1 NAD(+) kinase [Halobacteriovorax sp. DA5]